MARTPTAQPHSVAACSQCERYTDDYRRDGWRFYAVPDRHGRQPSMSVLFCSEACAKAWVAKDS